MRKSLIFPVAAAAGFLLACNMCGLGELFERFREGVEEDGGITLPDETREPDFEAFGLSLVLPNGWEMLDYQPTPGPSEMEAISGIFRSPDGMISTVTCIVDPEMFYGKTADEVARFTIYDPALDRPSPIHEARITLSGLRGYEATYILQEEETFIYRHIAVATEEDNRIFVLDFARYGSRSFTTADKREMKRFLDGVEID